MKKILTSFLVLALTLGALGMTMAAAADPGSSKDPLVTLSYLEDVFFDAILEKVDERIEARDEKIAEKISGTSGQTTAGAQTFTVVTLTQGQTLTGDIGCEVMLRVGSAVCTAPSAPGLIDETTASTLNSGGALAQNHLYMMTIEGRGVKATAATTKLLVRGTYTIA